MPFGAIDTYRVFLRVEEGTPPAQLGRFLADANNEFADLIEDSDGDKEKAYRKLVDLYKSDVHRDKVYATRCDGPSTSGTKPR